MRLPGGFRQAQGVAAGENANRNQFDAMTQQQINQLLSLLAQETNTTTAGTSQGTTNRRGSSLGFTGSWSPSGGFG